jgi:hypothetical protein
MANIVHPQRHSLAYRRAALFSLSASSARRKLANPIKKGRMDEMHRYGESELLPR